MHVGEFSSATSGTESLKKKSEKPSEVDQDILEKLKTYVEPIYSNGIAKTERFDEDSIKPLLRDTNFNKKDRDRLTDYNNHRLSGGYVSDN